MKWVALCAVLTAGGAHAQVFAFSNYNDVHGACEGRLLGMVNKIEDACSPTNGLGASGFMIPGSEFCHSCDMTCHVTYNPYLAGLIAVLADKLPPSLISLATEQLLALEESCF